MKDCSAHSKKMAREESKESPIQSTVLDQIDEFCQKIKQHLVLKLHQHVNREPAEKLHFHECLESFMGQLDESGTNDLTAGGNSDRVKAVAGEILRVVGAEPMDLPQNLRNPPSEVVVENFQKTPESVAQSIWESLKIQHRKLPESSVLKKVIYFSVF